MTIELTPAEIELLDKALVAWQVEPARDSFGKSLIQTMLGTGGEKNSRESIRKEIFDEMSTGQKESKQRERQAVLIRAKLISALQAAQVREAMAGDKI